MEFFAPESTLAPIGLGQITSISAHFADIVSSSAQADRSILAIEPNSLSYADSIFDPPGIVEIPSLSPNDLFDENLVEFARLSGAEIPNLEVGNDVDGNSIFYPFIPLTQVVRMSSASVR